MRALRNVFVVFVQGENRFKRFMTIEANIIVNGHGNLPQTSVGEIVRPPEIVNRGFLFAEKKPSLQPG